MIHLHCSAVALNYSFVYFHLINIYFFPISRWLPFLLTFLPSFSLTHFPSAFSKLPYLSFPLFLALCKFHLNSCQFCFFSHTFAYSLTYIFSLKCVILSWTIPLHSVPTLLISELCAITTRHEYSVYHYTCHYFLYRFVYR